MISVLESIFQKNQKREKTSLRDIENLANCSLDPEVLYKSEKTYKKHLVTIIYEDHYDYFHIIVGIFKDNRNRPYIFRTNAPHIPYTMVIRMQDAFDTILELYQDCTMFDRIFEFLIFDETHYNDFAQHINHHQKYHNISDKFYKFTSKVISEEKKLSKIPQLADNISDGECIQCSHARLSLFGKTPNVSLRNIGIAGVPLQKSCNILWHTNTIGNKEILPMINHLISQQVLDDCDFNAFITTLVRILRVYCPDIAKEYKNWFVKDENLLYLHIAPDLDLYAYNLLNKSYIHSVNKKTDQIEKIFIPLEVEAYYHGYCHLDPVVHCSAEQATMGYYFHPKGGTYKGLDITYGNKDYFLGFLIRSAMFLGTDGDLSTQGPSNTVTELISPYENLKDYKRDYKLVITYDRTDKNKLFHGPRYGINCDDYWRDIPYRYCIFPEIIEKQKKWKALKKSFEN